MGKRKDGHIPTCMLEDKTNLLSHMLPPYSAWKCLGNKMLEDIDERFKLYFASMGRLAHGKCALWQFKLKYLE